MNKQWTAEVEDVVAASGLPWRVSSCWCEERTGARCADLVHTATGNPRHVTVSREHLDTAASRQAEIIGQLQRPDPRRR